MNNRITAQVTIKPLTTEQKEWGLKGAIEALNILLKEDYIKKEDVLKLREEVRNQLESLTKN